MSLGDEGEDRILAVLQEIRDDSRTRRKDVVPWWATMTCVAVALVALLWTAFELHDSNCYSRIAFESFANSDSSRPEVPVRACAILPWNDPDDE